MNKKKAQTTIEYAALVSIVIGALIGAGTYFKRGVQGRWKSSVDDLGDQYDPRYADTNILHRLTGDTATDIETIRVVDGYWTLRNDMSTIRESKTGNRIIGAPPP